MFSNVSALGICLIAQKRMMLSDRCHNFVREVALLGRNFLRN